MRKTAAGQIIYSPSDLICYMASPFASWMERCRLETPGRFVPDEPSEEQRLVAEMGDQHEQAVLKAFQSDGFRLVEIDTLNADDARRQTDAALSSGADIIYQAALEDDPFMGYADFLIRDTSGAWQVWDTKLARSPKPYYAIQLCCYSEMLATLTASPLPRVFGIILGTRERVEMRVEDYIHYYRRLKTDFLALQDRFTGDVSERPEPLPRADHGRWASHAAAYFKDTDHLVQVAGISTGQIKKLVRAGITTMRALAKASSVNVPKLDGSTFESLVAQARLQCGTCDDRTKNPEALPRFELLSWKGMNGEPKGLAALPPPDPADVYFDMEGYPLAPGGLEYLFGAVTQEKNGLQFHDWWSHDRAEEKKALEGFIDWVYARWREHPHMHIYHYAPYEVSAVRRLSTRHDTRQDEVDDLLRGQVFVDLYRTVRETLRLGEDSYSIKRVERLYRPKRTTEVSTAADSIVQYARWIECGEPRDWRHSTILKDIRDYNEDDCRSTAELATWLRNLAREHGEAESDLVMAPVASTAPDDAETSRDAEKSNNAFDNQALVDALMAKADPLATTLAQLVNFHRREDKPMWWRFFDRAAASPNELFDDAGCIASVEAVGPPYQEKQSFVQAYAYDSNQEFKQTEKTQRFYFTHMLKPAFSLVSMDAPSGRLELKVGRKSLQGEPHDAIPRRGSLIPKEDFQKEGIKAAVVETVAGYLDGNLHPPVAALLTRKAPAAAMRKPGESVLVSSIRIAKSMSGDCLVIQGPPGTGKTYTASRTIMALVAQGKKVGITSNSHKAVVNLLAACGDAAREAGRKLRGIKVGDDADDPVFETNPDLKYVKESGGAYSAYSGGVVGGTAWLFTRPEWEGELDYLVVDEAGQVCLANAVAMARAARNLILLGDQMQLEQPVQGSHPGDSGLSVLQYALKDVAASRDDAPVFHAVVPADFGLFLDESRRMHPTICRFISESMYDGGLRANVDCERQRIDLSQGRHRFVPRESGIVFSGVEHDGNIQQSDEEVERVAAVFKELHGRRYTSKDGTVRSLDINDFLFIAPYNAQVRALKARLPEGARVGSVDKFQGQEAPVCVLSMCSSYGEYGSRGLGFILDRNRVNVAISRAQCLTVVVADPRIAGADADTLETMRLLNLFCKLLAFSNTT